VLYPQVSVVSDYRYYGLSSSNGEPTLQASLYLMRPDGFYGGAWATGVDYAYADSPTCEIDIYGGRNFDFGNTRLSFEVMASLFPDQSGQGPTFNFYQGITKLRQKLDRFTVGATVAWTPEGSFGGGEIWRVEGSFDYEANAWLNLDAEYGVNLSEFSQDRKYWGIGATARWKTVSFDFRYADTDLDRAQCFYTDWCDPSLVGKVTYNVPILGWKN